jgi:hypothetical protein
VVGEKAEQDRAVAHFPAVAVDLVESYLEQPGTWVTLLTDDMGDTFPSCLLLRGLWSLWATLCVVHRSIGPLRPQQAVAAMGDEAEEHRAIANCPAAIVDIGEGDRLAGQGFAEVDDLAAPLMSPLHRTRRTIAPASGSGERRMPSQRRKDGR